jgi:hypothetical protein
MSRRSFGPALVVVLVATLLLGAFPGGAHPAPSHGLGIYRPSVPLARVYTRWALGASPSPLFGALEGVCGARMGNDVFIAPPIAEGVDVRCRVPHGARIVFSHAAWFTLIPFDGSTDVEIVAAANAGFTPVVSWVRLDGRPVRLAGRSFNAGAFDVWSEPDSFLDQIGAGTGAVRTSITGTFLVIPPLPCGYHRLRAAVDFGIPDQSFSGTYRLRVCG